MTRDQLARLGWAAFTYERRLDNIRYVWGVTPGPNPRRVLNDEANMLLCVMFDAMSNDWAYVFSPEMVRKKAGDRMTAFLEKNANSSGIWTRVCTPLLADDLAKKGFLGAARKIREISKDNRKSGLVRFAEDDPFYDDLKREPDVIGLKLPEDARFLERFRFGEVLFSVFRNAWLHEGRLDDRLGPSIEYNGWDDTPSIRYQNLTRLDEAKQDGEEEGVRHFMVYDDEECQSRE